MSFINITVLVCRIQSVFVFRYIINLRFQNSYDVKMTLLILFAGLTATPTATTGGRKLYLQQLHYFDSAVELQYWSTSLHYFVTFVSRFIFACNAYITQSLYGLYGQTRTVNAYGHPKIYPRYGLIRSARTVSPVSSHGLYGCPTVSTVGRTVYTVSCYGQPELPNKEL